MENLTEIGFARAYRHVVPIGGNVTKAPQMPSAFAENCHRALFVAASPGRKTTICFHFGRFSG
jgi:hypothetical protein